MNFAVNKTTSPERSRRMPLTPYILILICLILLSGCAVGPKYRRPPAPTTPSFKEIPPQDSQAAKQWKEAQPSDQAIKGNWWELYQDARLNSLIEQVNVSNQNILAAEAQFRAARDAMRIARANLFPVVTAGVSVTNTRAPSGAIASSGGLSTTGSSASRTSYDLSTDFSYQADLWGDIRRSVTASARTAQASFADLENARLTSQATLAQAYFELHGVDAEQQLLERTVVSYKEYLQLTQERFQAGVASGADVAQAETQLSGAQAQLIDLGVSRAQFEHAIAVLAGKPPAEVTIAAAPITAQLPTIPVAMPSTLLERRPDIASAERLMAASNEQIGIAKAAYYPSVLIAASAGVHSTDPAQWFSWPSRFWAIGPQIAETIFSAGKRRAQVDQAKALYDATVADYRQTVLTAFQQVEDNLAALRILANEANAADQTVRASQQALEIATYQYKAGTADYLQVITAQTAALQAEITAINIRTRRMVASALLIEALGGGWEASTLPTQQQLVRGK
jgi:NodT family efflux transporter outer membrane factor (OMF) lipoprotein